MRPAPSQILAAGSRGVFVAHPAAGRCLTALVTLVTLACLALVACRVDQDKLPAPPRKPPEEVRLPPRRGPSPVRFVDATSESGITYVQDNGRSNDFFFVEQMSSGVAFFDADGDGDPDLLFVNGKKILGPPESPAPVNTFYRNDGKGHFTDDTAASGLGDPRYGVGVCCADYDNDGDEDVYVTNFDGPNGLYRNDGTGRFEDVAKQAGVEGKGDMDSACAFADVDGDGLLDLYVGAYADSSLRNNKVCEETRRDGLGKLRRYCPPKEHRPLPDILYHNRGDGTFEDWSGVSGIGSHTGRTLGVAFADYDDDGDPDIFVSCDRSPNLFFVNDGRGRFREIAGTNGTAVSDEGRIQAGMGIATSDFDGDGRIDAAVTYFEKESNGLYRNLGDNRFVQVERDSGSATASFFLMGWGTEFLDADLDGWPDWIVANGHLMDDIPMFREPVAGYEQPLLFYLNRGGGRFESLGEEAGPGLKTGHVGRGLATADIDGDGDCDVVISSLHAPATLLRNDSPRAGRHWLTVRLRGTKSNRDGVGARITVRMPSPSGLDRAGGSDGVGDPASPPPILVREIHTGQSYMSQSDLPAHFGLGAAAAVPELTVRWPSGSVTRLTNVKADQVLDIVEGKPVP